MAYERFNSIVRRAIFLAALLGLAGYAVQTANADDKDGGTDDPPPGSGSGGGSGGGGSGSSTGSPPDHRLAESETAYVGAVMLEGGVDVTMGDVVPGSVGDVGGVSRNGRFIGNTLYAEAVDDAGNAAAMVVEFYWFESSVPRGSDFFVGVVKSRTIPHLAENWVLEHDPVGPTDIVRPDRGAVLYTRAVTDPELNNGGFRWDWSLPFRDYGMDAYGTIRMSATYGVGLMGNGSAQTAYQTNEHGVEVEVEGQATGHLSTDYAVNTNYEITLHRWDVYTRNSAGMLEWSMFLRTGDREQRNAYHEFFIAMQVEQDGTFTIDSLETGGHIKHKRDFWFDEHRALSVAVQDITLTRPEGVMHSSGGPEEEEEEDDMGRPWEDDLPADGGTGGYDWPDDEEGFPSDDDSAASGGCSVADTPAPVAPAFFLVTLVGVAVLRRARKGARG